MSTKYPLILWSGGYDSTVLVMDAIEKGSPFDTLSITLKNNNLKGIQESKARKDILEVLKPGKLLRQYYEYTYNTICKIGDHTLFLQPLLWLNAIMFHLKKEHTEVQLGYHKGWDDVNGSVRFCDAYDSLFKLAYFSFKKTPLVLPLQNSSKEEILTSWYFNKDYKIGQEIRRLVWTCEGLRKQGKKIVKCDTTCEPCLLEAKTIFLIENFKLK